MKLSDKIFILRTENTDFQMISHIKIKFWRNMDKISAVNQAINSENNLMW